MAWKGVSIEPTFKTLATSSSRLAGNHVGEVKVTYGEQQKSVPVELKNDLPSPSWYWRLFR